MGMTDQRMQAFEAEEQKRRAENRDEARDAIKTALMKLSDCELSTETYRVVRENLRTAKFWLEGEQK